MTMPPSISAAAAAAAVLLRAAPALASMLPPCPPGNLVVDFAHPEDGADCHLCVFPPAEGERQGACAPACDGAECAASPPGCGEIVCPDPYVPPPNAPDCPGKMPAMGDPCSFASNCAYPETGDPYCSYECMQPEGQVVMLCMSMGMPIPPEKPREEPQPPRAEDCPDEMPEMQDPCDFESNCAYPETGDPYCSFDCLGGQVAMLCLAPPEPQPPIFSAPRAEDCPDKKPEMQDPCDFESNCAYPETGDPYCSFDCLGGQVAMLCAAPPEPEPPIFSAPRAEDCPDEMPEMQDPCDFESNCAYPETGDPYCSFACLGGQVAMLCQDIETPAQPEPPVFSGTLPVGEMEEEGTGAIPGDSLSGEDPGEDTDEDPVEDTDEDPVEDTDGDKDTDEGPDEDPVEDTDEDTSGADTASGGPEAGPVTTKDETGAGDGDPQSPEESSASGKDFFLPSFACALVVGAVSFTFA